MSAGGKGRVMVAELRARYEKAVRDERFQDAAMIKDELDKAIIKRDDSEQRDERVT